MNRIENAIKTLIEEKPFYAYFFLNSAIRYDVTGVPTAAAGIERDSTVLIFNREFMYSKTVTEIQAIVEHEILHLLFMHVADMKNDSLNKKAANVAMDVAINQYIDNLPADAVTITGLEKLLEKSLKPVETWEYYYGQLMDQDLSSVPEMDDHEAFFGEPGSNGQAVLRDTISKAVKSARGNVPGVVKNIIAEFNKPSEIPWKVLLRNFIGRATTSTTRFTRKRINRRFDLDAPGRVKKRELILGVCVDSSGSVSDTAYAAFINELLAASKVAAKVYLIEADCEVKNVEILKKNSKRTIERTGYGGTAYQPAIDKCMELKVDAIVYMGDFDTSDQPKNPGIPFLWVGVGNSPKPGDFGSEIRLTADNV